MAGVLVTRPLPEADRTAAAVAALGHVPLVDPMLTVRIVPGPPLDLRAAQAILATSVNGVRAAASRTDRRDLPLYAVGTRTAQVAAAEGFTKVEDAGGAAADLAARIVLRLDPAAGRLIHVGGREVAVDLAALLGPRGYRVTRVVGYEAVPASALSPATVAALRSGTLAYVLFFSPRTARTFVNLLSKEGELTDLCTGLSALCLSAAVAKGTSGPPWRSLSIAARPTSESLLALLPTA